MAKYNCLNSFLKDDVAQENAKAECDAVYWSVRVDVGGDVCPVNM